MSDTDSTTDPAALVREQCRSARSAADTIARLDDATRSDALRRAAVRLRSESDRIRAANDIDLEAGRSGGLSAALLDRLLLDAGRIDAMAEGLETVAALPDPLGAVIEQWNAPSGLDIAQVRIPIGVLGVIYESRPNVTADVAALALKSGNAVVLKGGKEAFTSNAAIADLLREEFDAASVPPGAVELLRSTDRRATEALLAQSDLVDVLVPRGGPSLVRAVSEQSKIPVIQHYEGVCSVYVDRAADLDHDEHEVDLGHAQAPVLFGDEHGGPAHLCAALPPCALEAVRVLCEFAYPVDGHLALQELAGRLPKELLVFGQVEVHVSFRPISLCREQRGRRIF